MGADLVARAHGTRRESWSEFSTALACGATAGFVLAASNDPVHHATRSAPDIIAIAGFLLLAAVAIRRIVPRPSLWWLAIALAYVTTWLVPQRRDAGSAIVLAAGFGLAVGLAAPKLPTAGSRSRRRSTWWSCIAVSCAFALWFVASDGIVLAATFAATALAAIAARCASARQPRLARVAITGTVVVLATVLVTGYFGASTVDARWFGGGVTHGPRTAREVAITFDDGPNIYATPAIMRILDAHGVSATFFVVGKALDAEPQVVRDLVAHGHLVGNHSYQHDQWRWLDPRYPELQRTQEAFARHGLPCPAWFRPPHGQRTPLMARVVRDRHMHLALWDVSGADWKSDDAGSIAADVLRKVRSGSIIDLHDGLDGDPSANRRVLVRALPVILDGLRARHLRVVRLDRMFDAAAYTPCR